MDFIVKLSVFKELEIDQFYNFIFVVTDRLIKYGYFIPCRENILAEDFAYLFNRHMIL
jgi:hypothetical protein